MKLTSLLLDPVTPFPQPWLWCLPLATLALATVLSVLFPVKPKDGAAA